MAKVHAFGTEESGLHSFNCHRITNISSPTKQARSDCGSYQDGGDLGDFGHEDMMKPFSDASFALDVGQITKNIVSTDSGYHLIMRTA